MLSREVKSPIKRLNVLKLLMYGLSFYFILFAGIFLLLYYTTKPMVVYKQTYDIMFLQHYFPNEATQMLRPTITSTPIITNVSAESYMPMCWNDYPQNSEDGLYSQASIWEHSLAFPPPNHSLFSLKSRPLRRTLLLRFPRPNP